MRVETRTYFAVRSDVLSSEPKNLHAAVAPLTGKIAEVCHGEPTACLQIVREFYLADEEADLGFWLDEPWLAIIRETGASLDVDEYDYTVCCGR